ncbi:hypothetical protein FOYG_15268 [Fusarium oxysporum NRRL 32931]|uniref:PD-(D/E)XK nuclease-like domain-containing protein n=1 Tax=Fusarium oxysporum NRRL 32931 TaxID=660029 RepID=W9HLC4_FUSOX|nr:hypothetical protein FOYG_15268 [Fusarium oxysporum NRRL 32931]
MSLDQRIHIWLGNIQQSIEDPSPTPEPYPDFPPNPMKRRRVDSPPRKTRRTLELQPGDPGYDPKRKKCVQYPPHIQKALLGMVSTSYRPSKKQATSNNHVSSEPQQQYCNFISYATGKTERRLIKRPNKPVLGPAPTAASLEPTREQRLQREIKVEPDTEPVLWPEVKAEPVTEPIKRTVVPILYPDSTPSPASQGWERLLQLEQELEQVVEARIKLEARKEPPPSALTILLKRINDIYAGRGILPSNIRPVMHATSQVAAWKDMAWARGGSQSDVHYCTQRHRVGDAPSPENVEKVMYQTSRCTRDGAQPNEWNMEVVQKVLELSFRNEHTCRRPQLVDFRCSTDGVVIPQYHTNPDTPQPPDFCVNIDTTCNKMPTAILGLEKHLYRNIFNHIDLGCIRWQRPIAFHVHTLPENTERELQRVRTAFAAHWGFLKRLVRLRERVDIKWPNYTWIDDSKYDLPEFLPGIIIYKHNWFLGVSKPDGENTRFYGIGDTASSIGVYKIVYALQILRNWAETVYWPWMQKLVLRWPLDEHGIQR